MGKRWLPYVAIGAALIGCGNSQQASRYVSQRAATPGATALAHIPGDSELVIEVDLARARANPGLTALWQSDVFAASLKQAIGASFTEVVLNNDVLVIASYGLGDPMSQGATLVTKGSFRPPESDLRGGHAILRQVPVASRQSSPAGALSDDFMRARDLAMPKAAKTAVVRATARLAFSERLRIAKMFGLEAVPEVFSLWGDLDDDFGLVMYLRDERGGSGTRLQKAARKAIARVLARLQLLPRVALRRALRFETQGSWVKITLYLGPKRWRSLLRLVSGAVVS